MSARKRGDIHSLSRAEGATREDAKWKLASQSHLHPVKGATSEEAEKVSEQRKLTSCRGQRARQVRTLRKPARGGTYILSRAEGWTGEDTEREPASKRGARTSANC
jgi:hypothetical protein